MPGDERMEFKIGKYQVEIKGHALHATDTKTGQIYTWPLLNGPGPTLEFLKKPPTEEELIEAFNY